MNEIAEGDSEAAQQRLELVAGIPVLAANDAALQLSQNLVTGAGLQGRMADDMAHIAIAAVHGMDYLVTWNCAHIANPRLEVKLQGIVRASGFSMPVLCTPQALLEEE